MSLKPPRRRYLIFAVSLVATVSLTAASCGSDDDDSTPDTTAAPATTATPAPAALPAPAPQAPLAAATTIATTTSAPADDNCVEADDPPRLALVVNQSAGDRGPVDILKAGLDSTVCSLGAETTFLEVLDPSTFESTFRDLGNQGVDVVALTFLPMGDALAAVAPDFPDTRWIHIYGNPLEADNVVTIDFEYWRGAFLAGMLGAALTSSDQIGIIPGDSSPPVNADVNAFKQGASMQNPDVSVNVAFTDSYNDPVIGKEVASAMYDDGVDIIMMSAAGSDAGMMEASEEKEGYTIGGSALYFDNPRVIGGVVIDWSKLIVNFINDALSDDYTARHATIGLDAGIFYLQINPLFRNTGPQEMVEALDNSWSAFNQAEEAVISGALEVPFNPDL